MIVLDDLPGLVRLVERINKGTDQAEGKFKHLLKELRDRYGCKSLEDAERHLARLDRKVKEAAVKYNLIYKKVRKKWPKSKIRKVLKELAKAGIKV